MYTRFNAKTHASMRFFSSFSGENIHTKNLIELTIKPHVAAVKELSVLQQIKTQEMEVKYHQLLKRRFEKKIVYTLSARAPEEMLKAGGLKKTCAELWLSMESGANSGCICFSLLPSITAIFKRSLKKAYIYAVVLNDEYFVPNSRWREIISPGAFPISSNDFFAVRELLAIKANGQLKLGPLMGQRGQERFLHGEQLAQFCSGRLMMPAAINQGDDYPLEFAIKDTPYSAQFQKEVTAYYHQLLAPKIEIAKQFKL
ncbi:MAG: hypothetical protein JO149_08360 [Gammaproteobacteria bacterium]|nr:hypothetical protein [Gammaproteobacteria bacterium]